MLNSLSSPELKQFKLTTKTVLVHNLIGLKNKTRFHSVTELFFAEPSQGTAVS